MSAISKLQLKAVQALWHVHAKRTLGVDPNDRQARLKWLSVATGRTIASSKDLSFAEAREVIDALKKSLGQVDKPRPRDRQFARALGMEGRRGNDDNAAMLVDERSLKIIDEYRQRLMWPELELQAWLAGKNSPLRGAHAIRTVGDARRVQYGMKGLLKAKGLWRKSAPAIKRERV